MAETILSIRNLQLDFVGDNGPVRALDGVSFSIQRSEVFSLVGESGSGKTISALSIGRLLATPPARYVGGEIWMGGQDVLKMPERDLPKIRGKVVSYIFQDAASSLNPVKTIGWQILETLHLHRPDVATETEVISLLDRVGIPSPSQRLKSYPHQLSGGMQQRVMIAMAIASHPQLLVADEPTTALDVTLQAQIMDLLNELRREFGMSILLISHNLDLVGMVADRVAVMYAGQIIEEGTASEILHHPRHPYTRALMQCVPRLGSKARRLPIIEGSVPAPGFFPSGCRFHPRCPQKQSDCSLIHPALLELPVGKVRCPYWQLTPPV